MDLGKIFENNSDCYADTWVTDENGNMGEGLVIMAMTKEKFIEVVNELLGGQISTTSCEPVLTLPDVMQPKGDPNCKLCSGKGYYSFSTFDGSTTTTKRCGCLQFGA